MLGNIEDAKLIYRRRKSGSGPLPKGWKKLGAGAFRTAYLSPDRLVYKVCWDDQDQDINRMEYKIYKRSIKKKLPSNWGLAKTGLFEWDENGNPVCISVMEYIEGKHPKHFASLSLDELDVHFEQIGATAVYKSLGLDDLHEYNFVLTDQGKYIIIDLGEEYF